MRRSNSEQHYDALTPAQRRSTHPEWPDGFDAGQIRKTWTAMAADGCQLSYQALTGQACRYFTVHPLQEASAMVGTRDSQFEYRSNAASAGLLAVRIASAAARARAGDALTPRDRELLNSVIRDLRKEARILRHEALPEVTDEAGYAFAGLALAAYQPADASGQAETEERDVAATDALDQVALDLEAVVASRDRDDPVLERVERLFLALDAIAARSLGGTGEMHQGSPRVSSASATLW